jgi:hypothetical protein
MQSETTPGAGVRTVVVPEMPTRGSPDAEKIYDFLLIVLGLIGAAVSGWSIATLLHDDGGMPWYLAYLGVGVYDLLAFMSGLMVYIRRAEPHRAVGAQAIMLVAIGGSAYVNYMHGRQIGGALVALILGAAPVVFEVAFAMRHNVLSVVTSILFPGAMWRRYRDGVWIKLHTGSLPVPSGSPPAALRQLPATSGELPVCPSGGVDRLPEPSGMSPEDVAGRSSDLADELSAKLPAVAGDRIEDLPEVDRRKVSDEDRKTVAVFLPEELPEPSGRLPVTPAERAEAVAEALRKGERITGETVASLYGVTDRTGRDYIRRAKAINAARTEGSAR